MLPARIHQQDTLAMSAPSVGSFKKEPPKGQLAQRFLAILGALLRFSLPCLPLLAVWGCWSGEAHPQRAIAPAPQLESSIPGRGFLQVLASHSLLADAVSSLGGEQVQLLRLMPPDRDPAFWQPTPEELERIQQADLIVLNGAGYEPWVASVALPSSRMLRTANSFRERWIATESVVHSHGPGGQHSHAGIASTTWLDLELAQAQVTSIRERLRQLLPEEGPQIEERFSSYVAELQQLDQRMLQLAGALGNRPIIVSHPVYQYWGRRYQLNLRAVHWEPGEPPGPEAWAELERTLQDFPATLFVWEAEPAGESRAALEARGILSLVFSPAANLTDERSWRAEMRGNLDRLEQLVESLTGE